MSEQEIREDFLDGFEDVQDDDNEFYDADEPHRGARNEELPHVPSPTVTPDYEDEEVTERHVGGPMLATAGGTATDQTDEIVEDVEMELPPYVAARPGAELL